MKQETRNSVRQAGAYLGCHTCGSKRRILTFLHPLILDFLKFTKGKKWKSYARENSGTVAVKLVTRARKVLSQGKYRVVFVADHIPPKALAGM